MFTTAATSRKNLSIFIESQNRCAEASGGDLSQIQFTSEPELFTEIYFLGVLRSGHHCNNLLSRMNCHIDLFKSMLNAALKEVRGHSYLMWLLLDANPNVRYLGIQLTTAFLRRVTLIAPDELDALIERDILALQEHATALRLGELLLLSLKDYNERNSGFAREFAYSVISASDEAPLAWPYMEECATELRNHELLPQRAARDSCALIARVYPSHAPEDSLKIEPLSSIEIASMKRMRDSMFSYLFPAESREETHEEGSRPRMGRV